MGNDQILKKLQIIYSEEIGVDPKEVTLYSDLREDLGVSDLELASIFSRIESVFDIMLPEREVRKALLSGELTTISDIIELIQEELE